VRRVRPIHRSAPTSEVPRSDAPSRPPVHQRSCPCSPRRRTRSRAHDRDECVGTRPSRGNRQRNVDPATTGVSTRSRRRRATPPLVRQCPTGICRPPGSLAQKDHRQRSDTRSSESESRSELARLPQPGHQEVRKAARGASHLGEELFEQWHRHNVAGAVSDITSRKYADWARATMKPD